MPRKSKVKTGGTWDPTDKQLMFIASGVGQIADASHNKNILIAVNELSPETGPATIRGWLKEGRNLFLDSGIFNLTMEHVRNHDDCSMDDALALAPQEIDGFEDLMASYLSIIGSLGDSCWGYIELDQGGRENKRKTRSFLETQGLRPIPVYHPLNDGWDYFDELAQRYDRICLGNIVYADIPTRARLIRTVLERRQKYPKLWIHGLGMGPSPLCMSLPLDSIDASTWLWPLRWPLWPSSTALTKLGKMPDDYLYRFDSESDASNGRSELTRLLGFHIVAEQRNWRAHIKGQKGIAC